MTDPAGADPVGWLRNLFGNVETGWLTIFSIDPKTGERSTEWAQIDSLDDLAATVAQPTATRDVWFGCATRKANTGGKRGGAADCEAITALWLDIDIAGPGHATNENLPPDRQAAHELLAAFPLPPTAIVDSGGGLQPWWALAEPLVAAEAAELLAAWKRTWERIAADKGYHIDNVFDLARIMRLPGTYNRKGEPKLVEIVEADWSRRYGVDDITQFIDEAPQQTETPAKAGSTWAGPQRPGDAYNAATAGGDVLAGAGWTLTQTDRNGDQYWKRPGSANAWGAVVYADGHTTVYSEAAQVPTGRPYDPFGLLVHLRFDGDFKRARQWLVDRGYGRRRDETSLANPALLDDKPRPIETVDDEWSEPVELFGDHTRPSFPVNALPAWMAELAIEIADRRQVPVDACCQMALGAFAAVAMKHARVAVHDAWTEPLCLYLATAMASGVGKSPVDKAMAGPLYKLDAMRCEAAAPEIDQANDRKEVLRRIAKSAEDAYIKNQSSENKQAMYEAKADVEMVPVPNDPRLLVDDCTPEGMIPLLVGPERLAVISSEAEVFDMVAGMYSNKRVNLSVYLKGWSGDPMKVDRKGNEKSGPTALSVAEPLLTIAVAVQPYVLEELRKHPELRGRGVTARFMYSMPRNDIGWLDTDRTMDDAPMMYEAAYRAEFLELASYLDSLPPGTFVRFGEAARERLRIWRASLEVRRRPGGDLCDMADWTAKLIGSVIRLAALLHLAEGIPVGAEISPRMFERAIAIGDYWIVHADLVARLWGGHPEDDFAHKVLVWLRDEGRSEVSRRDVHHKFQSALPRVDDAEAVIRVLVETGWLREIVSDEPPKAGRPKSPVYKVHPRNVSQGRNGNVTK